MANHERQQIVPLPDRNGERQRMAWAGVLSESAEDGVGTVGDPVAEAGCDSSSLKTEKTNRKERTRKGKGMAKAALRQEEDTAAGNAIAKSGVQEAQRPDEQEFGFQQEASKQEPVKKREGSERAGGVHAHVVGEDSNALNGNREGHLRSEIPQYVENGTGGIGTEYDSGSHLEGESSAAQWPVWRDGADNPTELIASDGPMNELDGEVIDLQQGGQQEEQEQVAEKEVSLPEENLAAEDTERWDDIPINRKTANPDGASKAPGLRAFPLLNQNEELCVDSDEHFSRLLACHPDLAIKVVSIFGNTGDGKSYTLNHTFFHGAPLFETSDKQDSCTAGAWAALDTSNKAIVVDTEGLLAASTNEYSRLRLLLKVLALSDVVIYCTKAERLHQDMFHFLKEASDAYCKYFDAELKKAAQALNSSTASVGPSLIIFHQTQNTQPLGANCHEELMPRFSVPGGCFPAAYSDVRYIGSRQQGGVTDFSPLQAMVRSRLDQVSVRLHRPIRVVHNQLAALNSKFAGELHAPVWGALPDHFFRCPYKCLSCGAQCLETVGHVTEHVPHRVAEQLCTYSGTYDNIEYVCQACIKKGKRNVVAQVENRTLGMAWGSKWNCCDCGIVYSSSYIGGNERDKIERLRPDYCHVWVDTPRQDVQGGNSARIAIEKVMQVAATVAAAGEQPMNAALGAIKRSTMPSYWIPDEEITHCRACARDLTGTTPGGESRKHHCRACGHGFCDACTQGKSPVPHRGWEDAVRVCDSCLEALERERADSAHPMQAPRSPGVGESGDEEWDKIESDPNLPEEQLQAPPVWQAAVRVPVETAVEAVEAAQKPNMPRRGVEILVDAGAFVQDRIADYSRAVAHMAAPDYWEKDTGHVMCVVCSSSLTDSVPDGAEGPDGQRRKHHCRACGKFVCWQCSEARRKVPSHGWLEDVRVCDNCNDKPDPL